MKKNELWLRIKNYHFDHIVPVKFKDQLASLFTGRNLGTQAFANKMHEKKGWNTKFAYDVIQEYKKFIYLGVISDFVVTPSLVIDEVWHQHILFSAAYRKFCDEVLEQNFDHYPEIINNADQTGVFQQQWNDTSELYIREFGFSPREDIWGKPKFDAKKIKESNYVSQRKPTSYTDDLPLIALLGTNADFSGLGMSSSVGDTGGSFSGGDSGGSGSSGSCGGGSGCSGGGCGGGCGGG